MERSIIVEIRTDSRLPVDEVIDQVVSKIPTDASHMWVGKYAPCESFNYDMTF